MNEVSIKVIKPEKFWLIDSRHYIFGGYKTIFRTNPYIIPYSLPLTNN
jgi:hypothetical protein